MSNSFFSLSSLFSVRVIRHSAGLVVLVSLFVTVFGNYTQWKLVLAWFAESGSNPLAFLSLVLFQFFLLTAIFSLLTAHKFFRWVLAFVMLVTAASSYFADSFGTVIDRVMLINAIETNANEAGDLLTFRFVLYLLGLFLIPTFLLRRIEILEQSPRLRLRSHILLGVGSIVALVVLVGTMSSFYVSFFREHKELRVYSSPLDVVYATYQLVSTNLMSKQLDFKAIGEDAAIPASDLDRELVIMVVGETARSDHFSLNGYSRPTNPLLSKKDVVSFTSVSSCGTSTAISVPCMFSIDEKTNFDVTRAKYEENAIDILSRSGVSILWRDNNSSSKGVADRVPYEDFRSPERNPLCDPECRDVGMLHGLEDFIDSHREGDILIVLHQMGSHGPAYFERTPRSFWSFSPICERIQLDQCSSDEILNSYDNTILYTDYFLNETIELLDKYDHKFETVFMYVGDHGESLGEKGVYLHGLPYFLAPEAQTKVPLILSFGSQHHDLDIDRLRRVADQPISHDYVFHTLLGLFEIKTEVYDHRKDLEELAERAESTED